MNVNIQTFICVHARSFAARCFVEGTGFQEPPAILEGLFRVHDERVKALEDDPIGHSFQSGALDLNNPVVRFLEADALPPVARDDAELDGRHRKPLIEDRVRQLLAAITRDPLIKGIILEGLSKPGGPVRRRQHHDSFQSVTVVSIESVPNDDVTQRVADQVIGRRSNLLVDVTV